jgi:hypothetical protein
MIRRRTAGCLSWALDEPQSSLQAGLVAAKIWGAAVGMMRAGTLRSKHGLVRYEYGENERLQRVVWFAKVPADFSEERLGHSPRDQISGETQTPESVSALLESRPAMPELAAASSGARAGADSPEDDANGGVSEDDDDDDDAEKNDDDGRGGRVEKNGRVVTRLVDVRIDTTVLVELEKAKEEHKFDLGPFERAVDEFKFLAENDVKRQAFYSGAFVGEQVRRCPAHLV